jgi:WD40 repeat protein
MQYEGHTGWIVGLDLYDSYLVSTSRDESIRIWSAYASLRPVRVLCDAFRCLFLLLWFALAANL